MWTNLHTLPAGTSMYTLYVTTDPEGTNRSAMTCEEVDVTCERVNGTCWDAPNYGKVWPSGEHVPSYLMEVYGDVRIIGIVNQTDGYIAWDGFKCENPMMRETGADDL